MSNFTHRYVTNINGGIGQTVYQFEDPILADGAPDLIPEPLATTIIISREKQTELGSPTNFLYVDRDSVFEGETIEYYQGDAITIPLRKVYTRPIAEIIFPGEPEFPPATSEYYYYVGGVTPTITKILSYPFLEDSYDPHSGQTLIVNSSVVNQFGLPSAFLKIPSKRSIYQYRDDSGKVYARRTIIK